MKYSIVIPIFPKNNFDVFCKIILPLYEKYLNWKEIHKFYLITPKKFVETLKSKSTNFRVEVLEEESLLNSSVLNYRGWFKQQILKLNISSILETDYYLVLDDDLFLIKPLQFKDFFNNKLIIYSNEGWTDDGPTFSTNSRWWKSACEVLNYDLTNILHSSTNMSVTPQLLRKKHSLSLIEELKKINSNWMLLFCERNLTEFSSYWVYLLKNQIQEYTPTGNKLWEHHLDINILTPGLNREMFRYIIAHSLSLKRHFFFVIQSYLNYPQDYYEDLLLNFLHNKTP